MIRIKAISYRILNEMIHDRRTLFIMFLAPILILTLMNLIFRSNEDTLFNVGFSHDIPAELSDALTDSEKIKIHSYQENTDEKEKISEKNLDAFITLDNSKIEVLYKNEDPSVTTGIKAILANSLNKMILENITTQLKSPATMPTYSISNSYLYGDEDSTFFDKIVPILISFVVFFFVFLISGMALLKERSSGTLERLLATPVKRSEIILGYIMGYGTFAFVQTLAIVLFAIYILDINAVGNIGWVLATNFLLALVALVMGIFISTFASSEFQMMQFIPIIVIPQLFFSGIISLDSMDTWVKNLSLIFPLTYASDALSNVMYKGLIETDFRNDLIVLMLFVIIFTFINILGLKKYRKV